MVTTDRQTDRQQTDRGTSPPVEASLRDGLISIHDHHQFPFTPSRVEDEGVVDKTECVTTTTVFL